MRPVTPVGNPPAEYEALEMLRSEVPSLLLLDFHMPGLNGAEVLSRLPSG